MAAARRPARRRWPRGAGPERSAGAPADQSHSHPRRACPSSARLVGIGVVDQQPGGEHRPARRSREARLQRRRVADVCDRHLRRRDRRLLPRHAGGDAVGRVSPAQRSAAGAREPGQRRGWTVVLGQPRELSASRGQRWPRSALSGRVRGASHRHVPPRRRAGRFPGVSGRGSRRQLVARRAAALRGVSRGPQTRRPSRADFMGDRADGSLQPLPLARRRSARCTGIRPSTAGREPI